MASDRSHLPVASAGLDVEPGRAALEGAEVVEVPDESRMRPVSEGLPIGTRVLKPGVPGGRGPRRGTVMRHQPEFSGGSFPVRFDDGLWEVLDTSYVTVVSTDTVAANTPPVRLRRPATRRVAS